LERRGQAQGEEEEDGKAKSRTSARRAVLKGADATSSLRPVGCISDQFPTRGTPTTSLCLARQVSASHKKFGPFWHVGPDAQREHHHHRLVWRNKSPRHVDTTAGGHAGSSPRQEP
jgi:hypothetical protein